MSVLTTLSSPCGPPCGYQGVWSKFALKDLEGLSSSGCLGLVFFFSPVRFLLTGSDGPLATSKTAPAEKSGLPVGPENGELSKEELIRRKREEFIQKHGKGLDKSR